MLLPLDMLICCAFIEARSCERMKLLSEHLDDPQLRKIYRDLLASEARHHATYLDLARQTDTVTTDALATRVAEIAAHEASILQDAPPVPRLHN